MGANGGESGLDKNSFEYKIEHDTATMEDIDKYADEIFHMPTVRDLNQWYKWFREELREFDIERPSDSTYTIVDIDGRVHLFSFTGLDTKEELQAQYKESGLTRSRVAYIAVEDGDGALNVTGFNTTNDFHQRLSHYALGYKNYAYADSRILRQHAAEVLKRKYRSAYSYFMKSNQW